MLTELTLPVRRDLEALDTCESLATEYRESSVPVVVVLPSTSDSIIHQEGSNVNTFLKKNKKKFFLKTY